MKDERKKIAFHAFTEAGDDAAKRKMAAQQLMRLWSCSERTVYRLARAGGWSSGRRTRSDKGRRSLDNAQIETIERFVQLSKRKDRHTIMPMNVALDVAIGAGYISEPISCSTLNRYLREDRMTRRQIEHDTDLGPHINMISKHPNHVHQFDITNCVQYFFGRDGPSAALKHRDMKKEFYIKKPENIKKIKKSLLRFMLVDHYSNAFYVQYRYAAGERAIDVCEFLLEVWAGPGSDCDQNVALPAGIYPLRGLPEILVFDGGSANVSDMVSHLTGSLNVRTIPHLPGNPRAKGSVEGMMWFWEQQFESRLSIQPAPDLDTLNRWALEMCARLNAEKPLSRTGISRSKMWLTIPPDKLRTLPPMETCKELLRSKPEERTVMSNLIVKYKGSEFRVPDPNLEGKKVLISLNPYRWAPAQAHADPDETSRDLTGTCPRRAVDVTWVSPDGEIHKYEALEVLRHPESGFRIGEKTAVWGEEYSSWRDTDTQRNIKELPTLEQIEAETANGLRPFEGHLDKVAPLADISLQGHRHSLETDISRPPEISNTQALMILRRELGRPLTEDEADQCALCRTRDQVMELAEDISHREYGDTENIEEEGA